MAEDDKPEETVELPKTQVAAPAHGAPAGKWHASRAVLIVLGVLAAIVVGGLGFVAGYAVGGDEGHHHRGDRHGPIEMRDEFRPGPPFHAEFRVPFERGDLPQQEAPQTSAPAAPTP